MGRLKGKGYNMLFSCDYVGVQHQLVQAARSDFIAMSGYQITKKGVTIAKLVEYCDIGMLDIDKLRSLYQIY